MYYSAAISEFEGRLLVENCTYRRCSVLEGAAPSPISVLGGAESSWVSTPGSCPLREPG